MPTDRITVWIETFDEMKNKGFDLSVINPHITSDKAISKPWEITTTLLERLREMTLIIESLNIELGNGDHDDVNE